MARMVVIYRTPKDAAAFDAHYFDVHVPLLAPEDGDVQMFLFDAIEV